MITLSKHSEGFDSPVAIVDARDGRKRFYVVERGGTITIVKRNGNVKNVPFLDVSSNLGPCDGYCAERGLLGLVFHPAYADNGYLYINYTSEDEDTGELKTIVSRFERNSTHPGYAVKNSELILLSFTQPYSNHNAGDLAFGPDGYLYITSGDGGYFGDPLNNGQDLNTMLGKILRIDVDNASNGKNYAVPSDNPFVSDSNSLDEIWAYGLRNPWKISFDSSTGDLFIADVGQNEWEEVNYQSSTSSGGENYGWRLMEGNHCYNPETNCDSEGLKMPILEYAHVDNACSVTGGYRYRGKRTKMVGTYFYGDYCNGHIWGATMEENGTWTTELVKESSGLFITSFGEDILGHIYVASRFYRAMIAKHFEL